MFDRAVLPNYIPSGEVYFYGVIYPYVEDAEDTMDFLVEEHNHLFSLYEQYKKGFISCDDLVEYYETDITFLSDNVERWDKVYGNSHLK